MMNILMSSRWFYPSLGGSERNAAILAGEFTRLGHAVKIITQTPGNNIAPDGTAFSFEVIRQPNHFKLLKLVQWCNIYFHNGISLRNAWPLLLIRRPWIIRHQIWIRYQDGTLTGMGGTTSNWLVHLKHFFVRFSVSIAISKPIAESLKFPSTVISNPYEDNTFYRLPNITKTKDIVYLGRLVSEKGVGLLLEAVANLKEYKLKPSLTIIGTGIEEPTLRQKALDLGIADKVTFVGAQVGEALVQMLNEHQIMVVPSLFDEPFGVVALEGIACGCVVVGSEGGGLKEAIGACGVTFPNGDVEALTQILFKLIAEPDGLEAYRANAETHLSAHKKAEVAKAYLQVFERAALWTK